MASCHHVQYCPDRAKHRLIVDLLCLLGIARRDLANSLASQKRFPCRGACIFVVEASRQRHVSYCNTQSSAERTRPCTTCWLPMHPNLILQHKLRLCRSHTRITAQNTGDVPGRHTKPSHAGRIRPSKKQLGPEPTTQIREDTARSLHKEVHRVHHHAKPVTGPGLQRGARSGVVFSQMCHTGASECGFSLSPNVKFQ